MLEYKVISEVQGINVANYLIESLTRVSQGKHKDNTAKENITGFKLPKWVEDRNV